MLSNKKGDLNLLMLGVMTLMMAGFLLVMGLIIMDELLVTVSDAVGSGNVTLTTVTEAGELVSNVSTQCGFNSMTVTHCINGTIGGGVDVVIPSTGNYSVDSREGRISYTGTDQAFNNTDWICLITFNYGDNDVCLSTNETLEGTGKFADYLDLIALAIVISVIIGLLIVVLGTRRIQ